MVIGIWVNIRATKNQANKGQLEGPSACPYLSILALDNNIYGLLTLTLVFSDKQDKGRIRQFIPIEEIGN